MARLPIPGSDDGTWGTILNDYLTQEHNGDGTHKAIVNPDATTTSKGKVQLAGDLGGTAAAPTVPGLAGKAPTTRLITAGAGLSGGGDLSADRTLAVVDNASIQKVEVAKGGTLSGTRKRVNFIEGSNVTITAADNAGSDRVDVTIASTGGGGGGEANTASNVGTGTGTIFKQKTGVDLELKTLKAGSGVTLTNNASDITIDATGGGGGEANTASNVGVGGIGVFKQKNGVNLEFKNVNAGSSKISVTNDAPNSEVDIDVVEANLTLGNLGGTLAINKGGTGQTTQTTAFNALDPLTTKGDIIVNNGTDSVRLPVGTDTHVLTADAAQATGVKWAVVPGGGGGEANTASNVGTAGVGVFKQKTGIDLEFKKLNAGSNKVTITDDTGNNEVDVDIAEANIVHQNLSGAGTNTHAQLDSHLAATAAHGATGAVVGTTNSQTLSNKVLTTPVIGDFTNAGHSHANTAGGGQLSETAFGAANIDGTAGTPSLRTIGPGAQQASAGNHTHTITKTHRIPHTWAISGTVAVPSGDTDFILPFFVPVPAGQTVTLKSARYVINSGTSVTAKLQKNGVDATGYTSISVTTTAASTTADVTFADNDKLALVVTAVSATPKNMTFTVYLDYAV